MEDPAELDARALRLEEEADNLEQAGRNAAAQGRLQQAKSLRDQATLQRQMQGLSGRNAGPATIEDFRALLTEPRFLASVIPLVRAINLHRIEVNASHCTSNLMSTILDRLSILVSRDRDLPDGLDPDSDDFLESIEPYTWTSHETDAEEVKKCLAWLVKHLQIEGVFILPVTNQEFMSGKWEVENVEMTLSKTDFLILHEAAREFLPEVLAGQESRQPIPAELLSVLRFVIAAYETKTTISLNGNVTKCWAQCAAQSLLLGHMLQSDCEHHRFVPVFGGDLCQHLVLHQADEDAWHVARSARSRDPARQAANDKMAVACMRTLIKRSLAAMDAQGSAEVQGVPPGSSVRQAAGSSASGSDDMDTSPRASDSKTGDGGQQSTRSHLQLQASPAGKQRALSMVTESQVQSIFSPEREAEWASIWPYLMGSDEHARAAGFPGALTEVQHSTLYQKFASMHVVM